MANVVIKQVPDGCGESVKHMAMVAIERFLRSQNVDPLIEEQEQITKGQMKDIRLANGMTPEGSEPDAS